MYACTHTFTYKTAATPQNKLWWLLQEAFGLLRNRHRERDVPVPHTPPLQSLSRPRRS